MKPASTFGTLFRRLRTAWFIASCCSPPLVSAAPLELIVEQDRITAGRLAQVVPAWKNLDPDIVLAYAPSPGVRRRVSRTELIRWGRDQGLELDPSRLPDALLVRRATRQLSHDETRELILNELAAGLRITRQQIHVALEDYRPALLPSGNLDFRLPQRNLVFNRVAPLAIEWKGADGRTGRFLVHASVKVHGSYAVAERDLPAGATISPGDLRFESGPLPGSPEDFLVTPPDVEGMELRSTLRAGRPLNRRLLVAATTIERGDLIQIRLRSGAVVLQTPARAEQSGSVGDRIQCRNLDSGRRVTARILSHKLAEVSSQ